MSMHDMWVCCERTPYFKFFPVPHPIPDNKTPYNPACCALICIMIHPTLHYDYRWSQASLPRHSDATNLHAAIHQILGSPGSRSA